MRPWGLVSESWFLGEENTDMSEGSKTAPTGPLTGPQEEALSLIAGNRRAPVTMIHGTVRRSLLRLGLINEWRDRHLGPRGVRCLGLTSAGMAAVDAAHLWPYRAQVWDYGSWLTVGSAPRQDAAADQLRASMSLAGLYQVDLIDHCKDLAEGHVLVADNGRRFRVAAPREGE